MDLLQKALTEALSRNSAEHERWSQYLQDHQQASESLEHFRKSIDVDIMVPVGSKALLPGKLYHTNEILLSHSSQIYSKCTSHQAQQVCSHRINVAKQRLDDFEKERNLYQNKLDLPVVQDAFTAPGEKEIIEEYDEAEERRWREEHHVKMRRHKQEEREEREKILASKDVDVIDLLDELELMEELDFELENLEIDSDEKFQKLFNGEITLPNGKQRTSHLLENESTDIVKSSPKIVESNTNHVTNKQIPRIPICLDDNANNEESSHEDDSSDSSESDDGSDEDLPEEFKAYQSEAEDMSMVAKQQFYRKKLHEVQTRLNASKVNTFDDFVRKTDQMFLCDHLQSEIDRLQDAIKDKGDTIEYAQPTKTDLKQSKKGGLLNSSRRSVSFGENEVTSFDKNQAPLKISEDIRNMSNDTDDQNEVKLTNEQIAEKNRVMDYVQKVASIDVDAVTAAMNARYQEKQIKLKTETDSKSILKNKEAVQREKRNPVKDHETEESTAKPLEEFNQIMGEIFEKIYPKDDTTNSVALLDPLPSGQLRDSHAPKARVSRFKASREKQ